MNPLFPRRRISTDNNNTDWSIPNLNRYNRDSSLPMNYGDYHTINTDAALKQFHQWQKKNGNMNNTVKPLLDLTKKINTKKNNMIMVNEKKSVNNALIIKEEDELKVDNMINHNNYNNNNNNNKIIINKPLVQAPPKPVHQIKQIIPMQSNTQPQPSIHSLSSTSSDNSIVNTQLSQSSSSLSPPSAIFYLFFFITSFDSINHSHTDSSSSLFSPLTILFEIGIHQQQLLQIEALHEFVLSIPLSQSSSQSPDLPSYHHHHHYQPKFRMANDDFSSSSPFEFRWSEGGWEIGVGEG